MPKLKTIFKYAKNRILIKKIRQKLYVKKYSKSNISDEDYLIGYGKLKLGYTMNLNNPVTFNEKLNWYKLHYKDPLMEICADKIKVDEYIKSKGLNDILTPKLVIWDNPNEIQLNFLPDKFVIKTNHDSGGVVVCRDKKDFNKDALKKIVYSYSKTYENISKEWVYENIEKKVFVEEYIETADGHSPADYKFFCFDGEPKFLFVGSERDIDVKFDFFDIDFNWIDVRQGHLNSVYRPQKPKNYERMLEICRILSKDFPHVRVDLYNVNGEIRFGELTFFHFAGLTPFNPFEFDKYFGGFFNIENIKKSKFFK